MPRPIPPDILPPEPEPDSTGSFVSDGLRLRYEVHGSGPTMIFHPGVGFPAIYFRPMVQHLRAYFRCVLLDPRGVAGSEEPKDDAHYALPYLARDVANLVEALELERAILFGHSLGANVMLETAVRFPEAVERLFLLSYAASTDLVVPFTRWVRTQATPAQRKVLLAHESAGPVLTDAGFADDYADVAGWVWAPHVLQQGLSNSVAWNMGQYEAPAGVLWGCDSAIDVTGLMTQIDQRADLHKLRCPVHLLFGRYDQYAASTVPLCRTYIPKITVDEVRGSNHHAHVEEPARVAERVLQRTAVRAPGALALRLDVRLTAGDDGPELFDDLTTRKLSVGELEADILAAFGQPLDQVTDTVFASLGPDYERDQVREAIEDFAASLSAMAFLDEGLSGDEIESRQRSARRQERAEEQRERLSAVLQTAAEKVAFHRERFTAAAELSDIPVMTKADVRANFPDRLAPDDVDIAALLSGGDLSINATSGSTDERLQVLFDYRVGRLPDCYHALWGVHVTRELVKGAVFTSPVCAGFECHLGKLPMEERIRDTTLTLNSCDDPMHITDDEVRAIVDEMGSFAPDVLFTNPWYAVRLVQRAAALDLEVPQVQVVLSSYQYLTLRHRLLLEDGLGARVFSYYGATDLGGSLIGSECTRGNMHVREDHIHLELTQSGQPVPPTEGGFSALGKVTVTTLQSPYMPLIRYDVGDIARWAPECDCDGGDGWACIHLEGRLKDALQVDGRIITTRDVDEAIGAHDVDFYRLSQEDRTFTLEAIMAPEGDEARIKARLARVLGPKARIVVDKVRTLAPERSLKFRQTVSHEPGPPDM